MVGALISEVSVETRARKEDPGHGPPGGLTGVSVLTLQSLPSASLDKVLDGLFGPTRAGVYHDRFSFRQESDVVDHNPLFTLLKVFDLDSEGPVTLKVFDAGGIAPEVREVARRMWDSEVRVLMRLFPYRWRRPGLMRFVAGDLDDASNTLFVAWEDAYRLTLADLLAAPTLTPPALQDLTVRVDLLCALCEALYELHAHGIIHRDITPRAICLWEERPPRAALSEFGLSVFLNNILWLPMHGTSLAAIPVRALAYSAPERLAFLAGGGQMVEAGEDYRQDIYSLGLVAVEWLTRRFDPGWSDTFLPPNGIYNEYEHFQWIQEQVWPRIDQARLSNDHEAERALKALLRKMVDFFSADRFPTAGQLVREAQHVRGIFRQRLFRELCRRTFKVVFDPRTCAPNLDTLSPREVDRESLPPEEKEQVLTAELLDDLSKGPFFLAPDTHPAYRMTSDGGQRWLLRGKHRLYRLEVFRSRYHNNAACPWLAYVFQIVRGSSGYQDPVPIPFHQLEVIPMQRVRSHVNNALPPGDVGRWDELLIHVRDTGAPDTHAAPRGHRVLVQALRECVELQDAASDLDTYPFTLLQQTHQSADPLSGSIVTMTYDASTDAAFTRDHPYMAAFEGTRDERVPFPRWLRTLRKGMRLEVAPEVSGLRNYRQRLRCIVDRLDPPTGRLTVRFPPGTMGCPVQGFVRAERPDTVRAQREAVDILADDVYRLDLLESPANMHVRSPRAAGQWLTGADPDPNKVSVINKWSKAYPLFLLQGPPGTGKTTTAAEIIAQIKSVDRGASILVTAQAHEALDNLLLEVLKYRAASSRRLTVLRVPSGSYEAKDERVQAVQPLSATESLARRAARRAEAFQLGTTQDGVSDASRVEAVRVSWRDLLTRRPSELLRLLYQTADVVFSTCLGARRLDRYEVGLFDWILVEEAARAHATELLVPLTRSDRWVLIGDHLQLEPFKADVFATAFRARVADGLHQLDTQESEAASDDERVLERAELERSHHYLALFSHLFANALAEQKDTLTGCYRMHPRLVELVDRLFYRPGGPDSNSPVLAPQVSSEARSHPFRLPDTNPDWLQGKAILWLDTSRHIHRRETPPGDGETSRSNALEVELIRRVVDVLSGRQ